MNQGNTGQRYKLRKFAKAEPYEHQSGPALLVTLACGHSYVVLSGDMAWYAREIAQGKKRRCNDCS